MKASIITVPASSANIGPGFDSAGIAVQRFLTLHVLPSEEWAFIHESECLPAVTDYQDHFIYQIAKKTAASYQKTLPSASIHVTSDIPLARGLGSSASAIIAGIELANMLCELHLTNEEKLKLACDIEGHPDNVAAALFGGCILAVQSKDGQINFTKLPRLDLELVMHIPNFELKTEDARKVLPDTYERDYATTASAISNLMIASLMSGDYALAGQMMEQDMFHEAFRAKLIPDFADIKEKAKALGAYGTVISGAGPTTISFVPKGEAEKIAAAMQSFLPDYEVVALQIDETGLQTTS